MAGRVRVPSPRRAAHGGAVYVLLVAFTLFILLPIGWMLTAALKPDTATIFTFPPEFFPTEHFEWGNFVASLTAEGEPYLRFVANTTFLVLMNMIGAVVSNSLIAYPFARLRFRGRNTLFIVLLGTLLLPAPVLLIPQFLLFFNIGWYGTYLPLIVPVVRRQRVLRVPAPPVHADHPARAGRGGEDRRRRLLHGLPADHPAAHDTGPDGRRGVHLPRHLERLLRPADLPPGPEMFTVAVALATQISRTGVEWNFLMASNLLAIIPPLVIYFFAQNKLIGGIASVGIRG